MSSATQEAARGSAEGLHIVEQAIDPSVGASTGSNPQVSPPEPSALRLILTLGIAGFSSGLLLVLVFLATAPAIERNRVEAVKRAVFDVLPGAESFAVLVPGSDGRLAVRDESLGIPSGEVVFAGFDSSGKAVGFAIPGAGPGFQDTLEILIGWDAAQQRVVGMSVLETRETPGLGDKIITDPAFTSSFENLALQAELVEPGRRARENEVDGISGATISAQAIVRIVNTSVQAWNEKLPDQATLVRDTSGRASSAANEGVDAPSLDGGPTR